MAEPAARRFTSSFTPLARTGSATIISGHRVRAMGALVGLGSAAALCSPIALCADTGGQHSRAGVGEQRDKELPYRPSLYTGTRIENGVRYTFSYQDGEESLVIMGPVENAEEPLEVLNAFRRQYLLPETETIGKAKVSINHCQCPREHHSWSRFCLNSSKLHEHTRSKRSQELALLENKVHVLEEDVENLRWRLEIARKKLAKAQRMFKEAAI